MNKFLLIFLFLIPYFLFSVQISFAYVDVFDVAGNRVFNGDRLLDIGASRSATGGFGFADVANRDRYFRDWGSQVTLEEWINNRLYEVKLGRFGTYFSPLTLQVERLRWGYPPNWNEWDRYWDQRNVRLRIVKGDNETIGLLAKTGDRGNSDDILNGDDIDIDRYLVAFRQKTRIGSTDIGFDFVNQHFTNFTSGGSGSGFFSNSGPLVGDIPDNVPLEIQLKFEDDLQTDDMGNFDGDGAAIFGIKVLINGVENPDMAVVRGLPSGTRVNLQGSYFTASDHIETNGPSDNARYSFYPTGGLNSSDLKSITFLIDAAKDYKISVNRNSGTEQVIFRAEGVPKTFSNRQILTYEYGDKTGDSILGVDMHGAIPLLDIAYNANLAFSKTFRKFPNRDGQRNSEDARMYFVEISREFPNTLLVAHFFDYDVNYAGDFSVQDNDDHDDIPDMIEDYVASSQEADRNANGRADYDEPIMRFLSDPIFRSDTRDLNNNGIYDSEENDAQPEYPLKFVRLGQRGRHFAMACRPMGNLKVEANYIQSERPEDLKRNLTVQNRNSYTFPLPLGSFKIYHEFKRVKDNIPDNTVGNNYWFQYQRNENNTDPLYFRDTIYNDTQATLEYNILPDLLVVARYNFNDRNQLYNKENYRTNFGIFRIRYNNWYPLEKIRLLSKWQVTPNYKFERYNQTKFDKDKFRSTSQDTLNNYFGISLMDKLSDKTSLVIAYEYALKRNLLASSMNNVNKIFVTQLIHQGKYWDKPLFLMAQYKRESLNYDYNFGSFDRFINREEEYMQLVTYFVW